ncbi:MAG: hypothetical protein PHZ19_08285 [Candidatus Thermoplasmatota archaeon]|nr:hypothetical protein [Candidatus Thermoplasmatota archaeon]
MELASIWRHEGYSHSGRLVRLGVSRGTQGQAEARNRDLMVAYPGLRSVWAQVGTCREDCDRVLCFGCPVHDGG